MAFHRKGDSVDSREFQKAAISCNKYVPGYLSGQRKLTNYPLDYIGMGDKNEAVAYVIDNRQAWRDTPGALPWLRKGKK
ncbi:MAG: hypothetical protein ACE5GZ_11105 [Gammaproteobacteria bacterium]